MGKGAIFSPEHEAWRNHPMLKVKYRQMYAPSCICSEALRSPLAPRGSACILSGHLPLAIAGSLDSGTRPPSLLHTALVSGSTIALLAGRVAIIEMC